MANPFPLATVLITESKNQKFSFVNWGYNMTIIKFLSWVLLVLLLSYLSVSLRLNNLLAKYKDKIKWVKRKSKLLEALLEDYNQLKKTKEEVESRARSLWDIEDLSQIHHHLSKDEKKWVASTKNVVDKAQHCCRKYAKQSQRSILGDIYVWMSTKGALQKLSPQSILCHIASISRWMTTKDVLHKLSPRSILGHIASISRWMRMTTKGVLHKLSPRSIPRLILGGIVDISIWMTTKGVRHKPIPQLTLDRIDSISRRMATRGVLHKISPPSIPQSNLGHIASISRRVLHKLRPQSIWSHIISIFVWMTTKDVLDKQIDDVESKLTDHFKKKDIQAKDIHMSMEESRSKARSLLDQYATEEGHKSKAGKPHNLDQNQKQKKPSTSFDELIKMSMEMDLFSGMEERQSIYLLLPLHAFLEDLNQLQLETETEKCWRAVAEEIIKDAEIHLSNYLWWLQTFDKFIKFKDIPFVTHRFREKMKLIVTEFNKLLKYNLTFIDRAAEKSTFSSIARDTEITSAMKRKLKNLETERKLNLSIMHSEFNSMCDELDKMHNQLDRAEATAGRVACVKQLNAIVLELEQRPLVALQIEMKNAINLLQHLTKTCIIERQSSNVVGLKIKEQDLVLKLIARNDNASILCIMGMKGVGKTALAKRVYYNEVVVKHFPTRVWMTVVAGAIKTTKVLLMKNDGTKDQTMNMNQVCCRHLKDMLCLVVLDNVSQKKDFDSLYQNLCGSRWKNESRIVVTKCFQAVALHVSSRSTVLPIPLHHIPLLTKEESWVLFQKVAAIENLTSKKQIELKEMETFAKKVVEKCDGVPLAILSLGFSMSAKGITRKSFQWAFEQFNHGRYKIHWLQAWENNRKELSESMRNCLYYFTKFPLDYEISARRLINLWVEEGLVEQNNQETPEDTAESYLEDFRDRSMIQVVALKSNGKIKTCCLPSMLREVIFSNRTNHSQYFDKHLDQRFAYNFDDDGLDAAIRNKGIPVSVLFFDKREGSEPGKRVGNILSTGIASEQFLKTRVLDLECIFRPRLPKTLSKLNNLKYLSLRWTYLEELPPCICKLQELETLDLKHTCINYIPSSIWELKELKKLYLPQNFRSKLEGKPRENVNKTLHTLWGVFLYGNYPLLGYLQNLKNLQKLKLAFQFNGSEQELQNTLAHKIVQLEQLHSLTLKSVDESGDPEKLILTDMLKLEKLSSLRLFGQLEDTFRVGVLPKNLTDLTLSASKLSVDPMPELQLMPKLKSLCFYADSYIEKKMVCASGFQELKVLRFWNLEKLEELDVIEGVMPKLLEFEVRSCKKLQVPTGLEHLKTIRIIKLRKMLKGFGKETQSLVDEKMPLVIVECEEMITNQGSQPSVSN